MDFPYGYDNERLTLEELDQRNQWSRLHPEFRRRLVAMFVDARNAGTDLGLGGGWRSSEAQTRLFLSRYVESVMGTVRWNGKRWKKLPNVASAAPPNSSYHEGTDTDGFAFAADLVGDLDWMNANCHRFGLTHFKNVNAEPWHVQPEELPRSRSKYRGQKLQRWALPELPNEEFVTMITLDYLKGTSKWIAFLWTGETLQWVVNGHADAVLGKAGVKRVDVDKDQLLGVIASSATVGAVPAGAEADIVRAWNSRLRK